MRLLLLIAIFGLWCGNSLAQSVSVKNGNIYLAQNGSSRQLTDRGLDSAPSLSPDKKLVVFVRGTPGKKIATGSGVSEATQLWSIGLDGKNATKILEGSANEEANKVLAGFESPRFSPDGERIYFQSAAFTTSGAIHVVNLKTGKETLFARATVLK